MLTVAGLGGSGNLTWSLGGLAPSSSTDGAGTWTNGAANFYNTGTSAAITWDNTATNNLAIGSGGAGGTITLGGNVRVGGTLTFAPVSPTYAVGANGGTNTLTLVGGITANNSATVNALTILEASQTWSVASGKTVTANGTVSETGGAKTLTKDGSGTLTLAGTSNSYSGGTVFGGGTVSVGSDANLGNTSGGLTFNDGTLQTSSGISSSRVVTVNSGGGTFDTNGFDSTLNGNVTGTGDLTKDGAGSLTLTGTNTFAGTLVNAGTLNNNGSYIGATTLVGGTLGIGSLGNTTISGSTVAVSFTGNNAALTNLGTLSQTGSGRTVRDNTGVTGLVINNGSATNSTALIQTANADVIQMNVAGGSVTLNNYGTMTSLNSSKGGAQVADFTAITTGANTINNYAPGITGGALNNSTTFTTSVTNHLGGIIQGNNGSGINLDGFNANQSATIINHGTIIGNGRDIGNSLSYDSDGLDVDGLVTVTNTGIIRSVNSFNIVADGVAHSEGITVGGGTITNSGTIEGLVSTGNTNAIGFGITFLGNDVTTGPLIGTREAIYANATVTNQAGGLIRGDSASGIFVDGPVSGFTVTINNNAGATIQGGGATMAAIQTAADNDTINNAGLIDGSSSGKAIDMGAGNNTLNIIGSSASILGSISGGVGGVGGTNSLVIDPGTGNSFFTSGAISNFATAEVKSGTVTLGGTNTYTGATNVTGGKLVVNGNISTSVLTTVANGASLAGNGTVGATLIQDGGILAPGNSIGTITANTVSFESGSSFTVEINSTVKTSDLLILAGTGPNTLTIGTGAVLTLGELGNPAGLPLRNRLTLVNYFASGANTGWNGGLLTYAGEELSDGEIFSALGYQFAINYDDTSNGAVSLLGGEQTNAGKFLTLTVVPEPGAAMLIGGIGLIGLLRRRRKFEDVSSLTMQ